MKLNNEDLKNVIGGATQITAAMQMAELALFFDRYPPGTATTNQAFSFNKTWLVGLGYVEGTNSFNTYMTEQMHLEGFPNYNA